MCSCVCKEGAQGVGGGGFVSAGGGALCDAQTGVMNKNPRLHTSSDIRVLTWINNRQPVSPVKDKNSNQSSVTKKISAECVKEKKRCI